MMGPELPKSLSDRSMAYTCPMHPKVRSERPGKCPECGMTRVPVGMAPPESNPGLGSSRGEFAHRQNDEGGSGQNGTSNPPVS